MNELFFSRNIIDLPHLRNESESKLQGGLQLPDHPLRVLLDTVPRELVLDVVQQVAHGIHVPHHCDPSVNAQQYLVQLDGQVEEDTHEPVSVESLEERTDKVENKEHLLLSLYEGHQPVSHQVERATDLGFIGFQMFS